MGFSALPYSEIESWSKLSGFALTRDEVRLIKFMDVALVSIANEKQKPGKHPVKGNSIPVSDTKGLKGMFDRLKDNKK